MKNLLLLILSFLSFVAFSQNAFIDELASRGEVFVSVNEKDLHKIPMIHQYSIDEITGEKATLYLNKKQYLKLKELNIAMELNTAPSMLKQVKMANSTRTLNDWDSYPDYETYVETMYDFAESFPEICSVDTIGYSIENRLILVLKISDNVETDETEPEFYYTSSMHGDELAGYVLMLRLADYLLNNYNTLDDVSNIINNVQLYINPLANPDGTFAGGNNSVYGATRYNSNSVDLNRNFPDPEDGTNPDGNSHQQENVAQMEFMAEHNFVMSMNFHGGAEVLNYPWDTWYESSHIHADADWFVHVCREYADTVHLYSNGYMNGFDDGITNGADWYSISGGRQDYVTYFLRGREITNELSDTKLPSASNLPLLWEYNYRSLLNFIEQATFGIHGTVTDANDNPLQAKIEILGHDMDSSHVRTDEYGKFYRYLAAGTYSLNVTSTEFDTTITDIQVQSWEQLSIKIGGSNFVDPTSITISGESGINEITTNGGTLQMVATLEPENANNSVSWSLSEGSEAYASISETGELTALENGVVTVKAVSTVVESLMDETEITITGQVTLVTGIVIESEDETIEIDVDGGTLQLSAVISPENATNNTVTWSSSADTIATVSTEGKVTAVANGTVTIKAVANDGSAVESTITLAISNQIGINEESTNSFTIYPNPVTDVLHIENADTIEKIELASLNGTIILLQENKATNKIALDIQDLNSGIYFVRIYTRTKMEVIKIVKS